MLQAPITKRLSIAAVLVIVAIGALGLPSRAQSPSPGPQLALRFVGGPVWRTPGQPLNVRLQVRNAGPDTFDGFRIIVGVSDRVLTRSALEASFVAEPGISASALPFVFDQEIEPFSATRVTIDESVDAFATLADASEGGVYPATFALQDPETLQVLATVQVPLIYYPEPPETRLNIVPLLPLNDRPYKGPDGRFLVGEDGTVPLVTSAREGGWLEGLLDVLEEMTEEPAPDEGGSKNTRRRGRAEAPEPAPLQVAISVGPRMVEELADLADGFTPVDGERVDEDSTASAAAAEMIRRLRAVIEREAVQPVVMPYAFNDIPTVVDRLPTDHLLEQFSAARGVLRENLGSDATRGWLFPPAGRLDNQSLERLQLIQDVAANTFVSSDSLQPAPELEGIAGCPELSQSFTCPISITTAQGTTTGFRADPGLSTRLAALQLEANDRAGLQRFFAETSMIREEAPGVEDRVIQATIPALWHPPPSLSRVLLQGLRDAPWLMSRSADEAVALAEPSQQTLIDNAPPLAAEPDPSFFESVQETSTLLDSFASFAPPDNSRLPRLRANLLVSQSRTLWRDPARTSGYISDSRVEAESEMQKARIEGTDDFTCTSTDCSLQLLLTNDAAYPATVSLELISPGLSLEPPRIDGTFEPGGHPVTIRAATNSSGISRLAARLETGDGSYLIQEKEIVIRSTNFNRIALIITIGALCFLILFYIARSIRRRRSSTGRET